LKHPILENLYHGGSLHSDDYFRGHKMQLQLLAVSFSGWAATKDFRWHCYKGGPAIGQFRTLPFWQFTVAVSQGPSGSTNIQPALTPANSTKSAHCSEPILRWFELGCVWFYSQDIICQCRPRPGRSELTQPHMGHLHNTSPCTQKINP